MSQLKLKASNRKDNEKAKELLKGGWIPAVIYNHGKTDHIRVSSKEVDQLFSHGISESTLINLNIDDKEDTAFIKDYQLHPLTSKILHIDFYRITFGEKIRTKVPLAFVGKCIGVKEGGILETFLHEVEIETFPKYLTPSLEIDISNLKIEDSIHIENIKLPPETKVLTEENLIVCQVLNSAKLVSQTESSSESAPEEESKKEVEQAKS